MVKTSHSQQESMIKLVEPLELSGQQSTILASLVKSYDMKAVSKAKFAKQNASDKSEESNTYGIIEEKLVYCVFGI